MDVTQKQLDRRQFLQAGAACALGAAVNSSMAEAVSSDGKKPNLVFLYTEGQRWDCTSLAGHPLLKTPNMDRIGREGVRFENAFCTNALCAPARASAMSGMWSRSTGALDNKTVHTPFPQDIRIALAHRLQKMIQGAPGLLAEYLQIKLGSVDLQLGLRQFPRYFKLRQSCRNYQEY
ncbi:MAG: sulfatase-like hydrolase/transferase [Edaphobacter sp.]|uniref:sulfatase-like hydrolase/transferase n=1 Tax=Edaphobacter sp. TaxID=1934404 RepID=UPI002389EDA9|nr:sulfatase-like hydrolase/transferase [Edaphobacter sp.]MDE1178003.1 sulfatase-like hydrolase/transferase [Edaphobacter sp.]